MTCAFENCKKPVQARGLCSAHYFQRYRAGVELRPIRKRVSPECAFHGCKKRVIAKDLCSAHYWQRKQGKELTATRVSKGRRQCGFSGCDRQCTYTDLCPAHMKQKKNGAVLTPIRGTTLTKYITKGKSNVAGYVILNIPRTATSRAYQIKEHKFIMEQYLGRKLFKHENVHHINGQRADNRIANLELWSKSQPCGQRVTDKIKWAKDLLSQYQNFDLIGD